MPRNSIIASLIAIALVVAHRVTSAPAPGAWQPFTAEERSAGVERKVGHLTLKNASLADAVTQLQKAGGANIILDTSDPESEILLPENWQITLDLHDLPLSTMLDRVVSFGGHSFPWQWFVKDGSFHIAPDPSGQTAAPLIVVRVYDVRDILDDAVSFRNQCWDALKTKGALLVLSDNPQNIRPDPFNRGLAQIQLFQDILEIVAPDVWSSRHVITNARIFDGRLCVAANDDTHRRIQAILHMLRRHPIGTGR